MRIIIASDHAGYEIKEFIGKFLEQKSYTVDNLGTFSPQESVDYPDYAGLACKKYLAKQDSYEFGILVCGTGIGISISANRIAGIRCALPQNSMAAALAREHNNANFLAFGGRIAYTDSIEDMLRAFITAKFDQRHQRRLDKIQLLES